MYFLRDWMAVEVSRLIREMSIANLLKLGIDIGQTSVAKYMARRRRPPSQGWRTFLLNHADGIAAIDLFVVATISFRLLYGLLVLGHGRRRILSLAVTAHPTAEWIARQVAEACARESAPRYLIRDRDRVYGEAFTRRIAAMGIRDRPTAPRSPWQNGYAERLIGSIRRECLDHVVVFGERHLRHVLRSYAEYYNGVRTHLSLVKDAPMTRPVQAIGRILPQPVLGGSTSPPTTSKRLLLSTCGARITTIHFALLSSITTKIFWHRDSVSAGTESRSFMLRSSVSKHPKMPENRTPPHGISVPA
jgi:transposase InsO family protein